MPETKPETKQCILAIDQGTTSTRVVGFDLDGTLIATAQQEHQQIYPQNGWVEHDPEEIWQHTKKGLVDVFEQVTHKGYAPENIRGIGITNQRETVVAWDKKTNAVLYNAIVWQDKRTASLCTELKNIHGVKIRNKTGLPTDPYFSGSKMHWLLHHVDAVKEANKQGTLAFGTMDSFLLWRLTGGKNHLTDSTNASRTLLFNIHKMAWSEELTTLFGIPPQTLPTVCPNTFDFGQTAEGLLPRTLPIAAMAGDQHAATFGQACFEKGMVKSTYGTGCFALMNTGNMAKTSQNGLLTTLAYHTGQHPVYALEGSIFVAGAAVRWLRDQLGLIRTADETEALAKQAEKDTPNGDDVYLVPAFAGLGAPWWDSQAKGALVGMTLNTNKATIAKATLEAVGFQSHDLFSAMASDSGQAITEVRVDGGMVVNNWLCQRLACLTQTPIQRPKVTETTALGAAWMAGLQLGLYKNTEQLTQLWQAQQTFKPLLEKDTVEKKRLGWHNALAAVRHQTSKQPKTGEI